MSSARLEYRCASCGTWSPMERTDADGTHPLLGATELEGDRRPVHYLIVPTCLGRARHELCDKCVVDETPCLACLRTRAASSFAPRQRTSVRKREAV